MNIEQSVGQTLDYFCKAKGTEFTQLHRPEEAIPDPYDKCEPGLKAIFLGNYLLKFNRLTFVTKLDGRAFKRHITC